ncbi:MAG: dTDP-4-dehydrorhamnose 3,5-epimerase [Burkholderiaceae bacterium]|nr:dTDP-4-dehydrorhamnose 3,5-epimerase [Burkholderiaceae bacterium]
MIFTETALPGATIVDVERHGDERGFFARVYCEREFAAQGLPSRMVQTSTSFTRRARTLRGMHWQLPPHAEDKLVRCVRGAIWDAIVDLRAESPTYCRWIGVELSDENDRMLLVPKGFAHGFVTLTDDVLVNYQISEFYSPACATGARHDDPAFAIQWPVAIETISERDRAWPDFMSSTKQGQDAS